MRKAETENFFLAYLLNVVLNLEWSIPAWILLGLHFWLDVPIYFFWIALGFWLGGTLLVMLVIALIRKSIPPDKPTVNKNPYSVTKESVLSPKKTDNESK